MSASQQSRDAVLALFREKLSAPLPLGVNWTEEMAALLDRVRAEGRAEERRDVVAFLRRCEGWRAPKLAESIDDECHVGDHELYSAAKDSP